MNIKIIGPSQATANKLPDSLIQQRKTKDSEKPQIQSFFSQSENFDISFDLGLDLEIGHQIPSKELKYLSKAGIDAPKSQCLKPGEFGGEIESLYKNFDNDQACKIIRVSSFEFGSFSTKMPSLTINSRKDDFSVKNAFSASKNLLPECPLIRNVSANPGLGGGDTSSPNIISLSLTHTNSAIQLRSPESPPEEIVSILESPTSQNGLQSPQRANIDLEDNIEVQRPHNAEPANLGSGQNQNQVELEVVNHEEPRPQVSGRSSNIISESECELYLRRSVVFFIATALSSFILFSVVQEKISVLALFISFYCYWTYTVGENIIASRNSSREAWRRKDDIFKVFDGISIIFALALVNLKIYAITPYCSAGCIPFMLTTIVYCYASKPRKSPIYNRLLIRCFYTLQVLLITLKLDGLLTWSWAAIFILIWIYLGVAALYFAVYSLFLMLHAVLALFRQHRDVTSNLPVILIGLLWYSAYYGLGVLGIFLFNKLSHALDLRESFESLKEMALAGVLINGVLAFFTTIFFKFLSKFIQISNSPSSSSNNSNPLRGSRTKKTESAFKTEKNQSYFIMASSTYFLPLNLPSLKKGKSAAVISNKKQFSPVNKKELSEEKSSSISLEQLQQSKQILDEKFKLILNKSEEKSEPYKRIMRRLTNQLTERSKNTSKAALDLLVSNNKDQSKSEPDNVSKSNIFNRQLSERENICYVCFHQSADAILMNCGHGGICYECAITAIKKKNACLECRAKVLSIYRVDPNPKVSNLIKAIEITRIPSV